MSSTGPKWHRWPQVKSGALEQWLLSDHNGVHFHLIGKNIPGFEEPDPNSPVNLTVGVMWYGPIPDPPDELVAMAKSQRADAAKSTMVEATANYFPPG